MRHKLDRLVARAKSMTHGLYPYGAEAFAEAACDEFFFRWPAGRKPTPDQFLALLEQYFEGIPVEVQYTTFDGRSRFEIQLTSLRKLRHADAGCEPGPPVFQHIIMCCDGASGFHVFTDAFGGATEALAYGLYVFVKEHSCREVLPEECCVPGLAEFTSKWRATHAPMIALPA